MAKATEDLLKITAEDAIVKLIKEKDKRPYDIDLDILLSAQ